MSYTDVTHFTHDHTLSPERNETQFTCSGCKEPGWGLRFRCSKGCDFILHKDCALGPKTLNHPFHNACSLKLRTPRWLEDTRCNACGELARGFVYTSGGYSLHPVCAALPPVVEQQELTLRLEECVRTTKCSRCGKRNLLGKKEKGWSYRSECKNYHLHVSCMKYWVVEKFERKHLCTNTDISSVPDLSLTCGSSSSSSGSKVKKISLQVLALVLNALISSLLGQALVDTSPFFT